MSVSFPAPWYSSAGKRFQFTAKIYVPNGEQVQLDNNQVKSFTCMNELNQLCMRARIIYADNAGILDSYRDRQMVLVDVRHVRLTEEYDGDFTCESNYSYNMFAHTFIVERIFPCGRSQTSEIMYQLDMRSANVINCRRHVEYSNYPNAEPITDIILACMRQAYMGDIIDAESFENCKSKKTMKYMTDGRDTVASVVKYLYSRMFYQDFQDQDSIPMLRFDPIRNKYFLVDFSTGLYTCDSNQDCITLSMDKSNIEKLANGGELVQVGSSGDVTKTGQTYRISDIKTYGFDYQTNSFINGSIRSSQLLNVYSGGSGGVVQSDKTNFQEKLSPTFDSESSISATNFVRNCAYWNNDLDIYDDFQDIMFRQNTPVFSTAGSIPRMPGQILQVDVSKKGDGGWVEDQKMNQEWQRRYAQLAGAWFIYSVLDMVQPSDGIFKQNIACFRNFVNKQ